jgi:hypothetical protein
MKINGDSDADFEAHGWPFRMSVVQVAQLGSMMTGRHYLTEHHYAPLIFFMSRTGLRPAAICFAT